MEHKEDIHIKRLQESILDSINYFSIFNFPLFLWEIHKYMDYPCTKETLKKVLEEMVSVKQIYCIQDCYFKDLNKDAVTAKKQGYTLALKRLKKAEKMARFIYRFPFVKMVAISGSLSKYSSKPDGDIDYFIVTAYNRLWISRTLLHLFKKLTFLVGKQHDFCMNYFVDTSTLKIEEENKFTAIEIASLIFKQGDDVSTAFKKQNAWIKHFVPNAYNEKESSPIKKGTKQQGALDKLNKKLMEITDHKWRLKWKKKGYDMSQYALAFKTSLSVSKNHPKNYQKRILDTYESKHQ